MTDNLNAGRLADAVAVVTGAGSGMGAAIARGFGREGAVVFVADIDTSAARVIADGIRADGGRGHAVTTDISDADAVEELFARVDAEAGRLDVLVNNAGLLRRHDFLDITESDWDAMHSVNTIGTVLCTQAAARRFIASATAGAVINISSTSASQPSGDFAVYASTKAAVRSLTQSSAKALAPHGIRVNALAPGIIDTPLWRSDPQTLRDRSIDDYVGGIPLGRLGVPDDVVEPAIFLATDASRYVTGQTLMVDGGVVML